MLAVALFWLVHAQKARQSVDVVLSQDGQRSDSDPIFGCGLVLEIYLGGEPRAIAAVLPIMPAQLRSALLGAFETRHKHRLSPFNIAAIRRQSEIGF